ncbi:MAG: hypothetical protein LBJ61_01645 [Deltaproteobacteria bacterium]|jgi:hypothetical protein|nr:hypothetical protein [Deltaproteobacteria bacterium]
MPKPKLDAIILAIALFISVSPIYRLIGQGEGRDDKLEGSSAKLEGDGKELIFFEGKFYDLRKAGALEPRFQDLLGSAERDRLALAARVNESYDGYVANVDYFLDWFYGLGSGSPRAGNPAGDSGQFLRDQLALKLATGQDQKSFSEELLSLNDDFLALTGTLARLKSDLAACEAPGPNPAPPAGGTDSASPPWPRTVTRSQTELEALGRALKALEGEALVLGPGSPLITAISARDTFIVAQQAIAYRPSNPDLTKLVSRQRFKEEILDSIGQQRRLALAFLSAR